MKTKNRWLIAASAVGIHISIGSIYAYSAWKMPLENTFGWKSTQTAEAFSIAIFFLGLSAAFLGKVIERKGPRVGGLLSAVFFCLGLAGAGLACQLENRLLFNLCFGVVSGIGLGLGYISPVSTLVKWFPDRRGLATGLAIMGFGFGGLVCTQLIDLSVPKIAEGEVPVSATYLKYAGYIGGTETLPEGVEVHKVALYAKENIVRAFWVLSGIYFLIMVPSALYISPPPEGYAERFAAAGKAIQSPHRELTAREALRTPGFYGLWIMLFLNVTCGIAVIATAKKMGYEMVHLTTEAASWLVMGISVFNGLGRIFWASLSDRIGRANTYIAFFAIQIVAFPLLANLTSVPWLFMIVTFVILTCYGGGFSSIPAYISDLFGLKEMPTIHGYILTAWSLAGVVGPRLNAEVYERTGSYQLSLYLFGGVFLVALIVSLLMKIEVGRLRNP
jgi:OFA family oxalate/formate antiporter-like MFS transporter